MDDDGDSPEDAPYSSLTSLKIVPEIDERLEETRGCPSVASSGDGDLDEVEEGLFRDLVVVVVVLVSVR